MSTPSLYFILFLALLLQLNSVVADVEETCKEAAHSSPNINFTFCVESLNSDPSSAKADTKGLAVIAITLAQSKANATIAKIGELLSNVTDAKEKQALDSCSGIYSDMISNLDESKSEVEDGKYGDANIHLSAAFDAPDDCENGFDELGLSSPITKDDKDAKGLCAIALFLDVKLSG